MSSGWKLEITYQVTNTDENKTARVIEIPLGTLILVKPSTTGDKVNDNRIEKKIGIITDSAIFRMYIEATMAITPRKIVFAL